MEAEKKVGKCLLICYVICLYIAFVFACITKNNIVSYFDAVYEDERDLVYQMAKGNYDLDEFPGARVYRDSRCGAIQVYYNHNEKWDFFLNFRIIIQTYEQKIEIPKYFISKEAYINDRTTRKICQIIFQMSFGLLICAISIIYIRNIVKSNNEELS